MQLFKRKVGHTSIVTQDGTKPGLFYINDDLAWKYSLTPYVNVLGLQHISILMVLLEPSQGPRSGDVEGEVV